MTIYTAYKVPVGWLLQCYCPRQRSRRQLSEFNIVWHGGAWHEHEQWVVKCGLPLRSNEMYKVRPQLRFCINSADASRFRLSVATYTHRRAKCEIYASVGYCRASTLAQAYLPSSFLTYSMILWTIKNLDGWKPCKPSKFDSIAVWHGREWDWRAACMRKIVAGRKTCRNTKTPVRQDIR